MPIFSNRDVLATSRAALRRCGVLVALVGLTQAARPVSAQQLDVTERDVWVGITGDVRVAPRAVVTFTSEARRTDGGSLPRQFFMHAGLLADVGHGIRLGGGVARWHTSPNDALGLRRASDERRVWQQLTGSHRTFGAGWNHRLRFEQRWVAPVEPDGEQRDWAYSARLRHQIRVVAPLDGRSPSASRLYAMPNVEVFVRTTRREGVLFDQTRLGAALGIAAGPRVNLEAGYIRQGTVHNGDWLEVHHVLQVTARVLLQPR